MIVLKMRKTTTCRGLSRLSSTLTNEKIEKKTIFVVSFLFLLSLRVNQNQGVCIMSKILVFGHQNPDTDAIGAAISFAYLQKN